MNTQRSLEGDVPLDHLGVIRARGADTTKFLQGQLTNDVASLTPGQAQLAGFCSAKGRLQATFIVWKNADDDVLLACTKSVLAPTLKRLSMFVLRAQCKLVDASDELALSGAVGDVARQSLGDMQAWARRDSDGITRIRLPDAEGLARCLVVRPVAVPAARADGGVDAGADGGVSADARGASGGAMAEAGTVPLTLPLWRWLEVRSAIPWIEAATVDRFVPQMLNFELIGGVDFQKGCYPGQEVVARSQYRGTIKRRMFLFESPSPTEPGAEVFHDADPAQPAGMVVNAAADSAGVWSALVECKLAAMEHDALHLSSADGAVLSAVALPYALAEAT